MKPLRVAVIVKNTPAAFRRESRNMGMWSYAVPEFTWEFFSPGKTFHLNRATFKKQGYDLIFHEDGGAWGKFTGGEIPYVYYAIDSTLTEEHHYKPRYEQAKQADLTLVDHDVLERFLIPGKPDPKRLSYCVNDKMFYPAYETIRRDICFHCGGGTLERANIRERLHTLATMRGFTYDSGTLGLEEYAHALGSHKIVVNVPRTIINRPHRIFDTMACNSALLTMNFPDIKTEGFIPGVHFKWLREPDDLLGAIEELLFNDKWQTIAMNGYNLVKQNHTWAVRAAQLRTLIYKEFKI